MADLTESGVSTSSVYGAGLAGNKKVNYKIQTIGTNPAANDTFTLFKLPAGAVVLGGKVRGSQIDTATTPTFDLDIGTSATADKFGNLGVLQATAVAGIKAETSYLYELNGQLKNGPITLTAETWIVAKVIASATTFTTGYISVQMDYLVP